MACKGIKGLKIHLKDSDEKEDAIETNSSDEDPFMPSYQICC